MAYFLRKKEKSSSNDLKKDSSGSTPLLQKKPTKHTGNRYRKSLKCKNVVNGAYKKKSSQEKPRWTPSMKSALLLTILEQKQLINIKSFNWTDIATQIGKPNKACKNQWKEDILPTLQKTFLKYEE